MFNTVTSKRDLVRQGHITLNMTFLISGSSEAGAMIFLQIVFWVKDLK